jgi:uncharacterized membrane protein YhfC
VFALQAGATFVAIAAAYWFRQSNGVAMNRKRFVLASFVIFVFALLWNGLIHLVILREADSILATIGRPEQERNLVLSILGSLLISVLFVWSYTRFARHGTIADGLFNGLYFGILTGVFVDLNQYVLYPLPATLPLSWFLFGLVEFSIYGILANRLYPIGSRADTQAPEAARRDIKRPYDRD